MGEFIAGICMPQAARAYACGLAMAALNDSYKRW